MPQFLSILSVIIITGSIFYYFYALTNGVILFMLAVTLILVILKIKNGAQRAGDSEIALARLYAAPRAWSPTAVGVAELHTNEPRAGGASARATSNPLAGPALTIIAFLLIAAAFYTLLSHQTTEALRSPWEVVPPYFFLLYGAVVFIMITTRRGDGERGASSTASSPPMRRTMPSDGAASRQDPEPQWAGPALIVVLTFLTLSVSLIIFPLGAGFDPFIHQATEKIIALTGTITPKPLYYIGQYTLVVFLSKITGLSVALIDKLLVPLLASIFLPLSIIEWWKESRRGDTLRGPRSSASSPEGAMPSERGAVGQDPEPWAGPAIILAFLTLPFLLTPFTTTTPYSLALLFLVVLIFSVQRLTLSVQLLLALATLLIHPLVGIPALIFVFFNKIKKNKNLLLTAYCLLASITIPAAFLIASQFSSQIQITFAPQNFWPWLSSLEWSGIYRENRFNAPLDLLYFYGFNIKNIFWFFIFTALVGLLRRFAPRNDRERGVTPEGGPPSSARNGVRTSDGGAGRQDLSPLAAGPLMIYLITFLILLCSYIIMSGFLSFNFLIGYEQADYAKRVLDIAQLFLIPLFLLGIHWWIARIPRFAAIVLFTLGITASLFLTYPQKVDSYSVSHAFNTSQDDIDAVHWIDADAHGEDYIVLANQTVSAAAIRELGFKKYYLKTITYKLSPITSIFFYPIPTGSPLYKFYLNMVYQKASSETMQNAMQLVGVKRSYFVLNRYWNDFDRIFTEANVNLQLVHSINNSVFIFTLR